MTGKAKISRRLGKRVSAEEQLLRRVTFASLVVAGGLIILKAIAWLATGSVAMLGSLLDSCLDFLASCGAAFSVRLALRAEDPDHRFGHGKAEAIAAFIQAGLVLLSAVWIIQESFVRMLTGGVEIPYGVIGVIVSLIALAATVGLVLYQKYVLSRVESLAVKADSLHYLSDIFGNGLVLLAFLASGMGLTWADPLGGLAVAGWLLWSAREIALEALDTLMDRELEAEDREEILRLVRARSEVLNVVRLRTRRAGRRKFMEVRVALDGAMRLYRGQAVAAGIASDLEAAFQGADVTVSLAAYDGSEEKEFV